MKVLMLADSEVIENISLFLRMRWPQVAITSASDRKAMIELIEKEKPDLVILDADLPEGLGILKEIGPSPPVPLITLTSREDKQIKFLEIGADDSLLKSVSPLELISRVNALFRRVNPKLVSKDSYFRGLLHINFATREVRVGSRQVKLTPTEFRLLYYLVCNEGRVMPKDVLVNKIWGLNYRGTGSEEQLRKYIYRLRSKLKEISPLILTEPGVGYRFVPPKE